MVESRKRPDSELIAAARKNPEAFGLIMERYQAPLFAYVRRISQLSKEEIEDLLQEIFIKIYQNINEYDETLKFSSWAYRVAHNHVVDNFRKMGARPRTRGLEEDELVFFLRSSVNLEKEFLSKDCLEKVEKCINHLPANYREILILRFLEEKNYEEIMDILKKSKGTIATLIARGRERLRSDMKSQGINCF